ncbi:Guanine/hypoxanthine permease PbuG [Vibrio stylophorae]|uniref:Guanine/hypoxanthine permease PbuG n=1 Tax=Vibrio stylophorae TaxID=659351 RepID=A0ABM8ZPW3_9VIBR|nr:NCS2 family permease [Vibrio stylophorae]CAH0532319.1 Guanine/hypoxanthine permease PbuG [Vibrio stylophorae]
MTSLSHTERLNHHPLLERIFQISARNSTVRTELYAGFVTFLAMCYILAVNPAILGSIDGVDKEAVFTATALASAFATLLMGFCGNYPVMLAPGMSMNGFFKGLLASGSVALLWHEALLGIFFSGIIFVIFSLTKIRRTMIEAIPEDLKLGITVSLGLFITFLGLKNAGIIVAKPIVMVGLGDISQPQVAIAFLSLFVALGCMVRKFKLATFIAFMTSILLSLGYDMAFGTELVRLPEQIVKMPPDMTPTFGAIFNFDSLTASKMFDLFFVVILFFIIDFFDGLSTIVGVGRDAGIINEDGKVPNARAALLADAGGTVVGAVMGTTSVTSFSESGIASAQGAKTGLAAVVVGLMFLCALFFSPIFAMFSTAIVAPAMIVVGLYMIGRLGQIHWDRVESRIAVFFTMVFTVLSFSPANGMAIGFVSYAFAMLIGGKGREVHPVIYGLSALFIAYLVLL